MNRKVRGCDVPFGHATCRCVGHQWPPPLSAERGALAQAGSQLLLPVQQVQLELFAQPLLQEQLVLSEVPLLAQLPPRRDPPVELRTWAWL